MGRKEYRKVKVTNLSVNHDNPRFEIVDDQREAISTMIQNQGDKLINLSEDILTDGLDPTNPPIIVSEPNNTERFIVAEGNRRIVTLKILNNPDLIPSGFSPFKKRIVKILKDKAVVNEVDCLWFEDENEAYKWIELRHTGENNGVGTVSWNAIQRERFQVKRGKSSVVLQAVDFVLKEGDVSSELKKQIKSMPITNLGRLLEDPEVRDELGVCIEEGNLATQLPKEEVLKVLSKVIEDIATKKINVNDIYYKKDKLTYVKSLHETHKSKKDEQLSTWSLQNGAPPTAQKGKKRTYPGSTQRKTIIPRNCNMQIPEKRVNNIFIELKRLKVDDFPNSGSILLRVFLELSLDCYIQNNSSIIKINIDNSPLHAKINAVATHFEDNKIMNKKELKPIRQSASKKDEFFSTETLNAYVHNKDLNPIPNNLKLTWDNIEPFIAHIWS